MPGIHPLHISISNECIRACSEKPVINQAPGSPECIFCLMSRLTPCLLPAAVLLFAVLFLPVLVGGDEVGNENSVDGHAVNIAIHDLDVRQVNLPEGAVA